MAAPEIDINGVTFVPTRVAAKAVSLSHDYIARLAREGKIMAVLVSRSWYVNPASLNEWVMANEVEKHSRSQLLQSERAAENQYAETVQRIAANGGCQHMQLAMAGRAAMVLLVAAVVGVGQFSFWQSGSLTNSVAQLASVLPTTEPVVVTASDSATGGSGSVETAVVVPVRNESVWITRDLGMVDARQYGPEVAYVQSWFREPVHIAWRDFTHQEGVLVTTRIVDTDDVVAFHVGDAPRPGRN